MELFVLLVSRVMLEITIETFSDRKLGLQCIVLLVERSSSHGLVEKSKHKSHEVMVLVDA